MAYQGTGCEGGASDVDGSSAAAPSACVVGSRLRDGARITAGVEDLLLLFFGGSDWSAASKSFSHPVQTLHGSLCTTSSGARSRCAARDARTRWISKVKNVRAEGSRRITTKVTIGEYHSHAEYSAVMSSERVAKPECEVFEEDIK